MMPQRVILIRNEPERLAAITAIQQTKFPFVVILKPPRRRYSRSQQNLLFAVIRYIAMETGNIGECYDAFKEEILRRQMGVNIRRFKMPDGAKIETEVRRSTTLLDKDGMNLMIERIYADAASWGIIVPAAEEMHHIAEINPFYDQK